MPPPITAGHTPHVSSYDSMCFWVAVAGRSTLQPPRGWECVAQTQKLYQRDTLKRHRCRGKPAPPGSDCLVLLPAASCRRPQCTTCFSWRTAPSPLRQTLPTAHTHDSTHPGEYPDKQCTRALTPCLTTEGDHTASSPSVCCQAVFGQCWKRQRMHLFGKKGALCTTVQQDCTSTKSDTPRLVLNAASTISERAGVSRIGPAPLAPTHPQQAVNTATPPAASDVTC